MLRRHLTITSGWPAALLSGALALAAFGCSDDRTGAGPRPPNAPPTDPEIGEDAPINLAYVCGNRFVVTNAQRFPVTVTYRVAESEEEGTVDLAAAPRMDPAMSEQTIEVRTKGAIRLPPGDRLRRDSGQRRSTVPVGRGEPCPGVGHRSAGGAMVGAVRLADRRHPHDALARRRVLAVGRQGHRRSGTRSPVRSSRCRAPANGSSVRGGRYSPDGQGVLRRRPYRGWTGLPNITHFRSRRQLLESVRAS